MRDKKIMIISTIILIMLLGYIAQYLAKLDSILVKTIYPY